MRLLDVARFDRDLLAAQFRSADPFPHVVLDDVISCEPATLLGSFPDPGWTGWRGYGDNYQRNKLICSDSSLFTGEIAQLVADLQSADFITWLQHVVGIESLIPDPYLEGGGLHLSGPGGVLSPHTDFHVYTRLNLFRRVNVLLYLNPGWEECMGGRLELFSAKQAEGPPRKRITPLWGRCVVFRTDDNSPHGFTEPVSGDAYRRSVATYYYTSRPTTAFSGDTNTYWLRHGRTGRFDRVRLATYQVLLKASRALSVMAHRANPNVARHGPPRP